MRGNLDRSAAARWAVAQAGAHERGTSNCSPAIIRWTRAMRLPVRLKLRGLRYPMLAARVR